MPHNILGEPLSLVPPSCSIQKPVLLTSPSMPHVPPAENRETVDTGIHSLTETVTEYAERYPLGSERAELPLLIGFRWSLLAHSRCWRISPRWNGSWIEPARVCPPHILGTARRRHRRLSSGVPQISPCTFCIHTHKSALRHPFTTEADLGQQLVCLGVGNTHNQSIPRDTPVLSGIVAAE